MLKGKFYVKNFGCKLNQYEGEAVRKKLSERGLDEVEDMEDADIVVVNTCAVTGRAEQKAAQYARKVDRKEGKRVILTGCLATLIEKNCEITHGNIPYDELIPQGAKLGRFGCNNEWGKISGFQGHTRAFLKIQDGCNRYCSYCIVPFIRGKPRSRDIHSLVEQVNTLTREGYKEVVLSGLHIGLYSFEKNGKQYNLNDLLETLLKETDMKRFRISSLEINEVNERLLSLISQSNGRIAPHLHLPIQSADKRILRAMDRPYGPHDALKVLVDIKKGNEDLQLGTDLIVGFPGEDDKSFRNTYSFLKTAPISHYHVFRYSDRPGTKAAEMEEKVDNKVKKERSKILRDLGESKKEQFYKNFIGRKLDVLFEKKSNGHWIGWSGNYIRVALKCDENLKNKLIQVKGIKYKNNKLVCER